MSLVERSLRMLTRLLDVALQDYTKYSFRVILINPTLISSVHRRYKARLNPPSPTSEDQPSPHIPAGPKKDYSLKEGQTFSISIPGRGNKLDTSKTGSLETNLLGSGTTMSSTTSVGGGIPLLPPPPSAPKRR